MEIQEPKDNSNLFSNFKSYLLLFEYPQIKNMDDEEIADIFKTPNRCFLISWILKILDPSYETKLKNLENNPEFLSTILYELGFVPSNTGLPFMTGKLQMMKQLKILRQIFKFTSNVTKIKSNKNASNDKDMNISDDILKLKTIDLNLFPRYGEIRIANEVTSSSQDQNIIISLDNIDQSDVVDVKESLEKFNDILMKIRNFQKFSETSQLLLQNDESKSENGIKFGSEFNETLDNCHSHLKTLVQYFEDIKTIQNMHCIKEVDDLSIKNNRTDLKEALNILVKDFSTTAELMRN